MTFPCDLRAKRGALLRCLLYGDGLRLWHYSDRCESAHIYGGASLVHGGLSAGGRRAVEHRSMDVECETSGDESSALNLHGATREPGTFYVGSLCAASHRVAQRMDAQPAFEGEYIVVRFHTTVFRGTYAGIKKWPPSPICVYDAVSRAVVARFLSELPLLMPRLVVVIKEQED